MPSPEIERIRGRIAPLRDSLLNHPVYDRIDGLPALRVFLEHHVFAVWDFMSLLKALQRQVCCVDVPWTPPADPTAARLINAIVLGEESDVDGQGRPASHFDLYRSAMQRAGADTDAIDRVLDRLRSGSTVADALGAPGVPEPARRFASRTFEVIDSGESHAIASAFAFGREDLLPDVFRKVVGAIDRDSGGRLAPFRYYLDRHIELDGDDHGPMAERLVANLCGADPARWKAAEDAATRALEARLDLWDGIADRLGPPADGPSSVGFPGHCR